MNATLSGHLADYLRLRRALGFILRQPGRDLSQFIAYLEAAGGEVITVEAALSWARLAQDASPITWSHRLGAVRGFARYMAAIDARTEIPPSGMFGKQQRRLPFIYTHEQIAALLAAADQLSPRLRAITYQNLVGLLAATGLRMGEAVHLRGPDVDLDDGVLRIRHAKFDRERLVPLHPSVTGHLAEYVTIRDRLAPLGRAETLFVSRTGNPLTTSQVDATFAALLAPAGLPTTAGLRPRVHDLRHSWVVHTLIGWHRDGIDITAALPVLSTYLGHVSPASTYWYISSVPELMHLVADRLEPAGRARNRQERS